MLAVGEKYETTKDLGSAEIAARIRHDIKIATATGRLPKGTKTSVRLRRFAGGCAIDVSITALPGDAILNTAWVRNSDPWKTNIGRLTETTTAAMATVEAIRSKYNRSDCDSMTDYFNVRYYGGTELDYAMITAAEKTILG